MMKQIIFLLQCNTAPSINFVCWRKRVYSKPIVIRKNSSTKQIVSCFSSFTFYFPNTEKRKKKEEERKT